MSKFKKKAKTPKVSADTADLTGVRVTFHWVMERGEDDDGNPTKTQVPVVQFLLADGEHIEAKLDDIAADRSVLTTLGDLMGAALTASADYESA